MDRWSELSAVWFIQEVVVGVEMDDGDVRRTKGVSVHAVIR